MIKNSGSLSSQSILLLEMSIYVGGCILFNNFRKEVLEQKVRTILESVNFSRKIKYKVGDC